jgi:cellulose synthase/poly-beta-1,6-N-acetylglucosamine synthase-like glycosyltransferase
MLVAVLQLFLVAFGLIYFVALAVAGLRVLARSRRSVTEARQAGLAPLGQPAHRGPSRRAAHRSAADREPSALRQLFRRAGNRLTVPMVTDSRVAATDPANLKLYFIIPCLNEELVIGQTVRDLLTISGARVVVVDDGSSDRTAEIAAGVDSARVMVHQRALPEARQGKGPALNAGLATVRADAESRGLAAEHVIVCVMDADGRLSRGAERAVLPLFGDPTVGGAQLAVRIRNRRDGILPRVQDALFVGLSATFQFARVHCGTVSLGGNGQFTRLIALNGLGRDPWRRSLTEDLDLSIALSVEGWWITTTAAAYVSQQGVTTVRALSTQWTRWYQGHMECIRWIPKLWSSRKLSHLGMLEITLFLLVPWVLVLPWSVLFEYTLWLMIRRTADWYTASSMGSDELEHTVSLVLWYLVSFAPNWIVGYLYHRLDRQTRLWKGIVTGHLLLVANLVAYAAAWRALYRIITGKHSWTKTERSNEVAVAARPAVATGGPALAGPHAVAPAYATASAAAPAAVASRRNSGGRTPGGHRGAPARHGSRKTAARARALATAGVAVPAQRSPADETQLLTTVGPD